MLGGPTIDRPVTARIARFAAKPRQIRVTWRPKGPLYFSKSALLRPLGEEEIPANHGIRWRQPTSILCSILQYRRRHRVGSDCFEISQGCESRCLEGLSGGPRRIRTYDTLIKSGVSVVPYYRLPCAIVLHGAVFAGRFCALVLECARAVVKRLVSRMSASDATLTANRLIGPD